MAEVESGRFNRTTVTVGQLLDKCLGMGERSQRSHTLYESARGLTAGSARSWEDIRLDKLEADTLDATYRRWLDEGLSPSTVHKCNCILSAACRQAVKWGWIDSALTARATPPRVERIEMKVPTPEQLSALVKAAEAEDPVVATAVALAALTGARRGELVELKWFEIDLANGRVRIARSFAVTQGEQDTGPTKTRQARDLAFDPVCVEVLRRSGGLHVRSVGSGRMPLVPDPFVLSYNANCEIRVNPDKLTHGFGRGLRASQRDEDLRIGVRSLLAPSPGERG